MWIYPVAAFRLSRFKSFWDGPWIELSELTALVGPNGSGKTSALQALSILLRLYFEPVHQILRDGLAIEQVGTEEGIELHLRARLTDTTLTLEAPVEDEDFIFPDGFEPFFDVQVHENERLIVRHPAQTGGDDTPLALCERLELYIDNESPPLLVRLDPSAVARASYSDADVPRVDIDGSGTAAVLADLAVSAPERFAEIQERVRSIIPEVERIRLVRAPVHRVETELVRIDDQAVERKRTQTYWGHRLVLDMKSKENLAASAVSDGTLIVVALLTLLHQSRPPRMLLIDDLEHGLHPLAQGRLIRLLREVVSSRLPHESLQIVMTSHSPFLIDHLKPEEVYLTDIDPETGGALCARLTEHPEFEQWKDSLGTGEFWSTFGEGWIHEREAAKSAAAASDDG